MNIQEFYHKTANISLNASLASLIPPFFLIIYGIIVTPSGKMIFMLIPFLLYSFICYQYFLINNRRFKEPFKWQKEVNQPVRVMEENEVLLAFMPAPTIKLLIFNSTGKQMGEIRDRKFQNYRWFLPYFFMQLGAGQYEFCDRENQLIRSFTIKKNRIEIMSADGNPSIIVYSKLSKERLTYIFQYGEKQVVVKRASQFMDCQFFNQDLTRIGRLRKGFMPIEWGNRFKDPNTPILTFQPSLATEDKLIIYAILTKLLRMTNH